MPSRVNDYNDKRNELKSALQPDDRRRLHEIAPYPIILTMMAIVHTHGNKLPDSRAQVYEECVKLLLDRWQAERTGKRENPKNQRNFRSLTRWGWLK